MPTKGLIPKKKSVLQLPKCLSLAIERKRSVMNGIKKNKNKQFVKKITLFSKKGLIVLRFTCCWVNMLLYSIEKFLLEKPAGGGRLTVAGNFRQAAFLRRNGKLPIVP